MASKELAIHIGCGLSTIQRLTKKAKENGQNTIYIKENRYLFREVHNQRGVSYAFKSVDEPGKARRVVSKQMSFAHLSELDGFDVMASKHSKEEKLLLVSFMRRYNYTMKITVESLLLGVGVVGDSKKTVALGKKFARWSRDFERGGVKALSDRRGKTRAKFSKIDEQILVSAIEGAGAQGVRENYYGVHHFYCYLYQKKYSDTFDPRAEQVISYSALAKGIKKILTLHSHLRDYWMGGEDALLQSYPVGYKDIQHPNQEWQVDATKFDFMCHYISRDGEQKIGRLNLTAVIDVYSGSVVSTLSERITSYDQVRVLYKAFGRMGIPEHVYTDNGKDYVSYHYSDVLYDLGITQIVAQAGQGRQKGKIERFFGKLQTELAKFPGYIGNSVAKKKVIEDQAASHIGVKTGKQTRIAAHRLLTVEEWAIIVENICASYSKDYAICEQVLPSSQELEDIRRRLGKKSSRPLHNDGIKLNAHTYVSAGLWTGGLAKGNSLDVYEDIDDIDTIYVYRDGVFVTKALNRTLGVEAISMEDHNAARRADRQHNVAPRQKSIRASKKLYEEYQDHNVTVAMKATPQYALPKPKANSAKPANNHASEQRARAEMLELMSRAGA